MAITFEDNSNNNKTIVIVLTIFLAIAAAGYFAWKSFSQSLPPVAVVSTDSNKLKVWDGAQWNTLVSLTNYVTTFTGQTTVTVNGTTHRLGTANLLAECYDSSTPAQRVEPDRVNIDPLTFNVTIVFASAQTGSCVITGSSGPTVGAGSGAGMASQLGDLSLVLTSSTTLTAWYVHSHTQSSRIKSSAR